MSVRRPHDSGRPPTPGADTPGAESQLDGLIRKAIDPLAVAARRQSGAGADRPGRGRPRRARRGRQALRYVCGAGTLSGFVGNRVPLDGGLAGRAIRSGRTLIAHDTEADDRVNRDTSRTFGVRSTVCVPLRRGGEPLGVLSVCSANVHAFHPPDVALLSELADFVSAVIWAAADFRGVTAASQRRRARSAARSRRFVVGVLDPAGATTAAERAAVERMLHRSSFFARVPTDLRPLEGESLFAVEALARFAGAAPEAPDVWLARSHRAGLGVDVELALIEAALAHFDRVPPDAMLAVNAGPEVLVSPRRSDPFARAQPRRVILELTEQAVVDDYPQLADALVELRGVGVRLAVDDAGAGWSSLMHILKLAPDFIKLDRRPNGIDIDPVRRSLASARVFAAETGAVIVAEGIETAAELAALRELGIRHAQGFYPGAADGHRGGGPSRPRRRCRPCRVRPPRHAERNAPDRAAVRNLIRAGVYWASRRVRKCRPTALLTALGVSRRVTLKPASVTIRRTSLLENRWGCARTKVVSRHFRLETSLKRASPSAEKVSTAT